MYTGMEISVLSDPCVGPHSDVAFRKHREVKLALCNHMVVLHVNVV